ncbi:hypothetical protein GALMADRAFT_251390 [Galerina marginata CBS 339.88]|uniref:Ribosomal protein mS38 C-terminal domain-containing protein n=1 Tax=Galerina marginata (strain CBS 339.88) TaxID=685588 RepID=A0A067SRX2_GALM3|nr:hypothetical protein GALMADRAFT_251390 [Galerina marginata CBS 339.88]
MSALSRLVYLPASRRAYSSYFSSKPGGGRYFNSAKPPKSAVVNAKGTTKGDSSSEVQENIQGASGASNAVKPGSRGDAQSSPSSSVVPDSSASLNNATSQSMDLTEAFAEFTQHHIPQLSITSKDYKTHQFFSLHRPLLLISQPSSMFRPVPPNHSIFSQLKPESEQSTQQKYGLDIPTDPFIDADAEAARQLTRALTMTKTGSTLSWESTMKHLGIDVSKDADRVNLQQQFDKEWEDVMMDSTKRKRRKKMKKHKLKKRRRATRSERLRLK